MTARGERHPAVLESERFHALRATTSRACATASTSSPPRAASVRGNVARDLGFQAALHVLRRQSLRGQPLRERRTRNGADVLQGVSSSSETASSTTGASPRSGSCSSPPTKSSPSQSSHHDNARGILLEGSYNNVFRGNVVAESDSRVCSTTPARGNRFEGNSFVANQTPLGPGRRTRHAV